MDFFEKFPLDNRQKNNRVFLVVIFLILLILTIFIDPRDVSLLSCTFKNATGYRCPTCGLSRSFYAMAHLDIGEAFGYHLLGPLLYLFVVSLFIKSSIELAAKKRLKTMLSQQIHKIFLAFLVVFWLILWINNFYK